MALVSNAHGALVVFGSGPGIGRTVAALFAERGFKKVILLSRDTGRLQEDAKFVSATSHAEVQTAKIDLADLGSVNTALAEVDNLLGDTRVDAVFFNAARLAASKLWEFKAEDLEVDLRVSVVSLYVVAQWAMPKLKKSSDEGSSSPSFLVTSGMLAKDPVPALFSLAASKAAQYSFVQSLHKEYYSHGVHCALIVVGGRVSDTAKLTTAKNVAEETWKLYRQPKGKGVLETVMVDPDYRFHIKQTEQEYRR